MSLLPKIKSRGYWEIVIQPLPFVEKRVANILDLRQIARTKQVAIRGWHFPHYGREGPQVGPDYVAQETDFLAHVEAWRFYQSGMFVYLGGYRVDWAAQDPPHDFVLGHPPVGTRLMGEDTVWVLTEAFEFAARLAMTAAGSDHMRIATTPHRLNGRCLGMLPSRYLSPRPPVESCDSLPQSGDFPREQLIAEAKALAVVWAQEVIRRFGWDVPLSILREIQEDAR